VASLRDLQRSFAAALRDGAQNAPVRPAANLAIYRNNSDWQFRHALSLSFPVLERRVGDDYFRQLAAHYRKRFPSRSGDLQWVGRDFAEFLAGHLSGGEYAWLADLARLEWSCERAAVAETRPALTVESLRGVAPEQLPQLVFALQPSLQLGASDYPVVSIWLANQGGIAPPVSQSAGPEAYLVLAGDNGLAVQRLTSSRLTYLSALASGETLGEAMAAAGFDEAGMLDALRFTFAEGLVCEVQSEKR
jgi:hypothetical protein